ncbi:MAG: M23 family metallopeptidase [Clostridia bacterium]|nr:M23 family metallopeptidase [Clostridia bacterium]
MDKNQNKKPKNSAIYIISVIMLITVLVIAVISAIGTANRTEDKSGIETDEAVITGKKDTKDKDTKATDKTTKDSADTKDTKDSESKDTKKNDGTSEAAAPIEFCLPVNGYISKDYSMDMPVFSLTMNDYRTHSGLDIQASVGSAVATVAEGEVTKRYTDPFMGVCIEVTHGGGLVSKYMNLGEEYPKDAEVGCKVYGGQTIGCVGESAAVEAADTSHLHFELLQDGKNVDPLEYISYEPMEDEYSE